MSPSGARYLCNDILIKQLSEHGFNIEQVTIVGKAVYRAGLAPALEHLPLECHQIQPFQRHIGRCNLTLHGEFTLANQI